MSDDPEVTREFLPGDSPRQAALFGVQQEQETSDDYYTPAWMFEAMGLEFDVDVCAPPSGIPWVPCRRFFTKAEDGLSQPWEGRVWMNPPYSQPTPWVRRFIAHGHGVSLTPFAKANWFHELWNAADALVAPGVRGSHFVGGAISYPVVLAAFGEECVAGISRLGVVRRAA